MIHYHKFLKFSISFYFYGVILFLAGVIVPNLVWKAGRTAEALRTITVTCFLAILQSHGINTDETVMFLLDSLVPLLLTLVEDASRKTRLYSCHALCHIVSAAQKMCKLSAEHIHNIYGGELDTFNLLKCEVWYLPCVSKRV